VGIEKRPMMSELFTATELAIMDRVRAAFDPARRLNPGKVLPGGSGCGEAHAHSFSALRGYAARADAEGPWI
jgi:hypothetical protein